MFGGLVTLSGSWPIPNRIPDLTIAGVRASTCQDSCPGALTQSVADARLVVGMTSQVLHFDRVKSGSASSEGRWAWLTGKTRQIMAQPCHDAGLEGMTRQQKTTIRGPFPPEHVALHLLHLLGTLA